MVRFSPVRGDSDVNVHLNSNSDEGGDDIGSIEANEITFRTGPEESNCLRKYEDQHQNHPRKYHSRLSFFSSMEQQTAQDDEEHAGQQEHASRLKIPVLLITFLPVLLVVRQAVLLIRRLLELHSLPTQDSFHDYWKDKMFTCQILSLVGNKNSTHPPTLQLVRESVMKIIYLSNNCDLVI